MNNQITILDKNNQSNIVDLICYFSAYNKKYVFFSKNEIVQDGLIKMYVAEENSGLTNDITQDEWNNLKKIMQGIITGNKDGIEFLSYNNPVKFNEPKAIALNDANINSIKTAYKNSVQLIGGSEPVLNRDILSQNFGSNIESVSSSEPVQISSIPNVQNNFNMESTPVNLNTTPAFQEGAPANEVGISSMPNIEPINPEIVLPSIEPLPEIIEPSIPNVLESAQNNNINNENALNINSIKPGGIDSGFRVSNEPNIFDNPAIPYQMSEEEINNTNIPTTNNVLNSEPVIQDNNDNTFNISNPNDNIIKNKKIELNNKKIKLFEELANIYKEENELLNRENNENEDSPLEKTASNLFNNNGTLNDNEVLG